MPIKATGAGRPRSALKPSMLSAARCTLNSDDRSTPGDVMKLSYGPAAVAAESSGLRDLFGRPVMDVADMPFPCT